MSVISKIKIIGLAIQQLGINEVGLFALYRLGILTGYFHLVTKNIPLINNHQVYEIKPVFHLPDRESLRNALGEPCINNLITEADDIKNGNYRFFGNELLPMEWSPNEPWKHWTYYEKRGFQNSQNSKDIKWAWEVGRFGWAYILARAYYLTKDESYCTCFWDYFESFFNDNPPYLGIQWTSAQEVAIRLMSLIFNGQIFSYSPSTTNSHQEKMTQAVLVHARRILPTLIYARSQNNNHLLSEAAGLYSAACALPDHPEASHWRHIGWKWFIKGLRSQIAPNGSYIQQSTNYHRLMLQLSLWINLLLHFQFQSYPQDVLNRLQAATQWITDLAEPDSGAVPNLGANDGADIMPLSTADFSNFTPVINASWSAFFKRLWSDHDGDDEMVLWMAGNSYHASEVPENHTDNHRSRPDFQRLSDRDHHIKAYLRTAHYTARPVHADQLHLDIWWHGQNIARDAGTYLYNALPPWDNSLASTCVHNTLTINKTDQMLRAGRFLWLNWAQSEVVECTKVANGEIRHLAAMHDGYHRIGFEHSRSVDLDNSTIEVRDVLQPRVGFGCEPVECTLNWLLPDYEWKVISHQNSSVCINFLSEIGNFTVEISAKLILPARNDDPEIIFRLIRASECIYGEGLVNPILGWYSPTYGKKEPALSLNVSLCGIPPIALESIWRFS